MEIEKPGMNIWMQEKCSIPGIFVVVIIESLWGQRHRELVLFKWIFPLLSINNILDNAF